MVENLPTHEWLMCSEAEGVGSLSFSRTFTELVKMLMYLVDSFMLNHPSNLRAESWDDFEGPRMCLVFSMNFIINCKTDKTLKLSDFFGIIYVLKLSCNVFLTVVHFCDVFYSLWRCYLIWPLVTYWLPIMYIFGTVQVKHYAVLRRA